MYRDLWAELSETTSEDKLIRVVTDGLGNEVHIIQQSIFDKGGKLAERCVMAVYPNGILYPEYADKTVLDACREAGKLLKQEGDI